MKRTMKNVLILFVTCLALNSTAFGQEADTLDLTPAKAYINESDDTCFCWCGAQLNRITEYKTNSEGCDSLVVLKKVLIAKQKGVIDTQEAEKAELEKAGELKDETIAGLHADVKKEKTKTKGAVVVGVLLTILTLIFG